MAIFHGAVSGTLVKLKCPHCGEIQARSRVLDKMACKKCRQIFSRNDGERALKAAGPAGKT